MTDAAFAAALGQASPSLTERAASIVAGKAVPPRVVRRVVLSVLRYRLRAAHRATPFGLFAGVAPARIESGRPVGRIGVNHRTVLQPDSRWLATTVSMLEQHPMVTPQLRVVANNLIRMRGNRLILEHQAADAPGRPPTTTTVRVTAPIRATMRWTSTPIALGTLVEKLHATFPAVAPDVIVTLLTGLVRHRLLVTCLSPGTTATEPTEHIRRTLSDLSASELPILATALEDLGGFSRQPETSPLRGGADLFLDAEVAIPSRVAEEAATTADLLLRLSEPGLGRHWRAWHRRFLERFGPRTLVPLRTATDPVLGVGYPAGFVGGPSTEDPRPVNDLDRKLFGLAQNAAMRGLTEIQLDHADINALRNENEAPQPSTEITVQIHASSADHLAEGEFTMSVVGVSRGIGTVTGRFLHGFHEADRDHFAAQYRNMPTVTQDALPVQVSACPPHATSGHIVRAPRVATHVVHVGEYHDPADPGVIPLDDIAVAADAGRLLLVSVSRRRVIEPFLLNAVELTRYAHPVARFLVEAPRALTQPCVNFHWGAADILPFVPGVVVGRTRISAARWRLTSTDLPSADAPWDAWDEAFEQWREGVHCPDQVQTGTGDRLITLDLKEPAHRALVRADLDRTAAVSLRAAASTPTANGWTDGYTHEITVPLVRSQPAHPAPSWLTTAAPLHSGAARLPGDGGPLLVKLYAPAEIHGPLLVSHVPQLINDLHRTYGPFPWWHLRYRDPDDHIRLRLALPTIEATAFACISTWAANLRDAALVSRVQFDTDFPETARFGGPEAFSAAEEYFAADSAAARAALAVHQHHGLDLGALAAAGIVDIAAGLLGDTDEAMAWLIANARTQPKPPPRDIYDLAVDLADPEQHRLTTVPDGLDIAARWARRRHTLGAYRHALRQARVPTTDVLPDLIHLHYVRVAGIDPDGERSCMHLARAAALRWTARTRKAT